MFSSLPGLVAYRLREGDPEQDRNKVPSTVEALIKSVLIAAAVAIVAFVVLSLAPLILAAVAAVIAVFAAVLAGGFELIISPGRDRLPLPADVARAGTWH